MDVEPALFADALGATLTGGFFCAQAARRAMGDRGVIVNITDIAALEAWPSFAPHAAAKAALAQLTRSLARAFAPGVRVCAVAPGPVLLPDDSDEGTRARQAARTALGRLGSGGHRGRRRLSDRGRHFRLQAARRRRRPRPIVSPSSPRPPIRQALVAPIMRARLFAANPCRVA
jgi:NAD(P)-dependent dehydrogenase (short-subunit alcohol dehydrogenase family)